MGMHSNEFQPLFRRPWRINKPILTADPVADSTLLVADRFTDGRQVFLHTRYFALYLRFYSPSLHQDIFGLLK